MNLNNFYLTESTQNEIHKTLYDLSLLHPFLNNHKLIKSFLNQLNYTNLDIAEISNNDLLELRKDVAYFIGQLSKQTVSGDALDNLIRISEQNALAIAFHVLTDLIRNKEIRAYKGYINSQNSNENFELKIDEIIQSIEKEQTHAE